MSELSPEPSCRPHHSPLAGGLILSGCLSPITYSPAIPRPGPLAQTFLEALDHTSTSLQCCWGFPQAPQSQHAPSASCELPLPAPIHPSAQAGKWSLSWTSPCVTPQCFCHFLLCPQPPGECCTGQVLQKYLLNECVNESIY